ncbi:MAG: hypothetical protein KGZ58_01370 [Ignavibacteriales bacterium]|nr:hypothetical protein [Ignavibacteriales bacterium]
MKISSNNKDETFDKVNFKLNLLIALVLLWIVINGPVCTTLFEYFFHR